MSNAQVVFVAPGRVEVHPRPMPRPGAGEVLIQTLRTLISTGTETTLLKRDERIGAAWASMATFPRDVGYSNVGRVVECGDGVAVTWQGRVVDTHGSHAAFVCVREEELRPLPAGVDPESATFCSLAEVAMNGVRRGGVTWGERVVVGGLGLVGQLAARACALAGARPVVGFDRSRERLAFFPKGSAYLPLSADAADLAGEVRKASGDALPDVAIEASGNPEVIRVLAGMLRPQGRLVVLSGPAREVSYNFHDLCNRNSLSIIGAHYFSHPPRATDDAPWSAKRHAQVFMEALARREFEVASLVTQRFPFARAADAYRLLMEQPSAALGVVLEWAE